MRWAMALQTYNFNVEYRKGAQNANADGLSCQAWEEPQPTADDQRHQPSEGGGVRDQCLTYTAGSSLETGRA